MSCTYQQQCPVIFGVGAIKELGAAAKSFGAKKALLLYDEGIRAAGIVELAADSLNKEGICFSEYGAIEPEAPDTCIDTIGKMVYGSDTDLIIGLGGGSVMDTAKAVSVLVEHEPPIRQYYSSLGNGMFKSDKVHLILVATNSGTGSEVTQISVVHDMSRDVKDTILRPGDLAIVDPALAVTCSPEFTASSAMDAMSHAIEAYTSIAPTPKDDILALEAIRAIYQNVEVAYNNGSSIDARTALSFGSNIAGISFADASTHVGHCAAHELGVQLNQPHGVMCALSIPATIEFCAETLPEKTRKLAEVFGVSCEGLSPLEIGNKTADVVRSLCRRLNIPSLSSLGCSKEKALSCAEGAVNNNWFHIMAPRTLGVDEMREYIATMYDKY